MVERESEADCTVWKARPEDNTREQKQARQKDGLCRLHHTCSISAGYCCIFTHKANICCCQCLVWVTNTLLCILQLGMFPAHCVHFLPGLDNAANNQPIMHQKLPGPYTTLVHSSDTTYQLSKFNRTGLFTDAAIIRRGSAYYARIMP